MQPVTASQPGVPKRLSNRLAFQDGKATGWDDSLAASCGEVMACLVRVPTENVKQKIQVILPTKTHMRTATVHAHKVSLERSADIIHLTNYAHDTGRDLQDDEGVCELHRGRRRPSRILPRLPHHRRPRGAILSDPGVCWDWMAQGFPCGRP